MLSDEQKEVIRAIMANISKEPVQTLGGYAGTGKTVIVSILAQTLKNWAFCAYTGKAANQMRIKGVSNAKTIHSTIYKPYEQDGEIFFDLVPHSEFLYKGFVVDEASMVSAEIDKDLRSFGVPIIYVGDHGQLEPIGSDFNIMASPMHKLETIHRNAGEIAYFAEHLRKGNSPWTFSCEEKVQVGLETEITDNHLLETDQLICAYNKFRVKTNDHIRRLLNRKKVIEKNEKVMCLKNNKKHGIFNGMQGTVLRLYQGDKFDFFANENEFKYINFDREQFGKEKTELKSGRDAPIPFDYAYCITAHKSQGAEFDRVIVYEQKCQNWDHKRWIYTAASRAKHSLIWLALPKPFIPKWL